MLDILCFGTQKNICGIYFCKSDSGSCVLKVSITYALAFPTHLFYMAWVDP